MLFFVALEALQEAYSLLERDMRFLKTYLAVLTLVFEGSLPRTRSLLSDERGEGGRFGLGVGRVPLWSCHCDLGQATCLYQTFCFLICYLAVTELGEIVFNLVSAGCSGGELLARRPLVFPPVDH